MDIVNFHRYIVYSDLNKYKAKFNTKQTLKHQYLETRSFKHHPKKSSITKSNQFNNMLWLPLLKYLIIPLIMGIVLVIFGSIHPKVTKKFRL